MHYSARGSESESHHHIRTWGMFIFALFYDNEIPSVED